MAHDSVFREPQFSSSTPASGFAEPVHDDETKHDINRDTNRDLKPRPRRTTRRRSAA